MRYLSFLLVALVPAITIVAVATWRLRRDIDVPQALRAILYVSAIALAYTTPWDNYLIHRGVWWYGPDRVLGTLGYVPVEEYLFMVLQSIATGLFAIVVFRRSGSAVEDRKARLAGVLGWIALAIAGGWMLVWGGDPWLYAGLILSWAGPVLAGTWWLGYRRFVGSWRRYVLACGLPSVYLWLWDAIAIRDGIWSISADYTSGLALGALPVEEAAFFLLTNVLVVQGVLLFYAPSST